MDRQLESVSRGDLVTVSTVEHELEDLTVYRAKKDESNIRMKGECYAYKIRKSTDRLILMNETKGRRIGEVQSVSVSDR